MITAIFDLDGTIADTISDLGNAVDHGLEVLGFQKHTVQEYKRFVGNGAMKLCERALPEGHKDLAPELHRLFKEYYSAHLLDNTRPYDGIKEALEKLSKSGVRLAVATNKPEDAAKKVIAGLLPDIPFEKVLGGCEERAKKPDTAIIKEILGGLPATGDVYMIGDSDVDIMTGKNAGITTIGCTWGFRGLQELKNTGADHIAEKASDIVDIILSQK